MAFVSVSWTSGNASQSRARTCVVKPVRMSALSNVDADAASENKAMSEFRSLVAAERQAALTQLRSSLQTRKDMWAEGVSEKKLLTFAGQLDLEYARLQRWKNQSGFSVAGGRVTGVPGLNLPSIGALDYQDTSIKV
uniref:Uncharacterized protein n=1 Tax=Compsopogon caeruleus TaxID=31354 RepID=A0A7S1XFC7_9RHOD|mmetsp:Transcript_5970/g.11738  ORF Transcript_5970/g.11738 Transcript_5970/m.11738 type:complete len:137 (+) Transcript_5970:101-511(+)